MPLSILLAWFGDRLILIGSGEAFSAPLPILSPFDAFWIPE